LKNGEIQFQTLASVNKIPKNGGYIKTIYNPSIYELSVGKKTNKFVLGETILLESNEVMTFYRKFTKEAWVRTPIED
jgi:hypothetical protein